MAQRILRKRYENFFGVDLKSTDLVRPEQFASGMMNAQYRKSGSIEKRKGYQGHAASEGGHGLFVYNRVNPTSNAEEPETLSISNKLHKLLESTLTVTYTGSDPTALISVFYDTSNDEFRCQILEGASTVLDQSLGIGFDEASPVTIGTLQTNVNALTNFTASVTGATTTPAAFIKVVRNHDLTAEAYDGIASYWSDVNKTVTAPFAGSETNKNSLDFENVSATQINNVIYFANGYDEVQKYDGQTIYRAGLTAPPSVIVSLVGSGSITGSNYLHKAQFIQKDAVGNIIEGNLTTSASGPLTAAGDDFLVTIGALAQSSGFNTNCALATSNQVGVTTIAVDDGSGGDHSLQVGDTAYFLDRSTSAYVEREVTARTTTTIDIAGAAVDVNNNDAISNNLRIGIYRNKTSASATPTVFFLVAEVPNDSYTASVQFTDALPDASLGAQLIEPVVDRSPPQKGKYISQFRNQMVTAGNQSAQTTVYYSDVDSPEYFPAGSNSFNIDTVAGDIITGISPNNEVFAVFKTKSIHIVSGNIADGTIRIDQLTSDIGCAAHATIQELRGSLIFLSDRGPYIMTGGQIPAPAGGNRIEPVFDASGLAEEVKVLLFSTQILTDAHTFRLKRSVAVNDRDNERYILYVPTETVTSTNRHANANSKIFVLDYNRDAFLIWTNMNMAGGVAVNGDEFYFSERRYSTFNSSVDHILYRRLNIGDAFDYQDNNIAVDFSYDSQWETLGEPSVLKKMLRLRFFGLEELANNDLVVTVKEEHNYVRDVTQGEFTLTFSASGYGVAAYSTSQYGNPLEATLKHKLSHGRVRSHRLRFSNNREQENVILTGWEVEAAPTHRLGYKS